MIHLSLPLVSAVLAFLAGLLPGLRFGGSPGALALAAAVPLAFAALARREEPSRALGRFPVPPLLLAAFALAGAAVGAGGHREALTDCRATLPDGARVSVRGVLAASARGGAGEGAPAPLLPLRVEEVRTRGGAHPGCTGEVRVRLPRDAAPMRAGTEVVLRGEWMRFSGPVVRTAWPRDPAFAGVLTVREVGAQSPPRLSAHPLLTLRGRTEAHLQRLFPRHAALADALLLGRREGLDPEIRERFARSGLVHLLAISGTHVALIAAALLLLGRVLRLPPRAVTWTTIALLALYLAVIGAPPSAVRAGVMIALALTGLLLQRPHAALPVVAAAALVILAFDPLAALNPGFQLSFAGVLGILLLRGALLRHLPEGWKTRAPVRWTAESLAVSLAAFLATAPITAAHFGQVAPIAVLANLPAIPLTSLALVGICAAAVAGLVALPLGQMFAGGAGVALDLLDAVARAAAAVPFGHAAVSPPAWGVWAGVAVAVLLALDAAVRLRAPVRSAVALGAGGAALLALPVVGVPRASGLEIHFLDVGQGDAIALRTPADRWLLIDAGPRTERTDAGERRVLPFLRAHRARRVEALILTHPDADHLGGARAVLEGIEVGRVIDPGLPVGKPLYLETLRAAEGRGVAWAAALRGRTLRLDGVELDFLWPEGPLLDADEEANKISAVVRVRYGAFTALFTGDVDAEVEAVLAARYGGGLRADLLKAGHHGSATSTSEALLDAARPGLVVVSAGRRNRYGHPAPEVLRRLHGRGIPVARTDREGTVSLRVLRGGSSGWERMAR